MVVFTCNHCGESLQKPRVEKHYHMQCRGFKSLTCVDCLKDFKGEEYAVHTKCLTEDERYAAKGSMPNGNVKKGEAKQESWTEMIRSIVDNDVNLKVSVKNLLNNISSFPNIPRKKQKFINFLKSSMGGRVQFNDIEGAWDVIEKYKIEKSKNSNNATNGQKRKLDVEAPEPANKKAKVEETNGNGKVEETSEDSEIFSFKGTILSILNEKNSISSKKLQKKVMNAYLKVTGNTEITEKTIKKYNKKLKKLPNVVLSGDLVELKV